MAVGGWICDQEYGMEVEQAVKVVVADQGSNMSHDVIQGPGDHGRVTIADEDDKGDTNSDTDSMSIDSADWTVKKPDKDLGTRTTLLDTRGG